MNMETTQQRKIGLTMLAMIDTGIDYEDSINKTVVAGRLMVVDDIAQLSEKGAACLGDTLKAQKSFWLGDKYLAGWKVNKVRGILTELSGKEVKYELLSEGPYFVFSGPKVIYISSRDRSARASAIVLVTKDELETVTPGTGNGETILKNSIIDMVRNELIAECRDAVEEKKNLMG